MTQELCSFCLNQSCQSTSPPHTSPFIGSAGISGTSKMCIQIRYLRDLQFCAAPVQQCVPQYVQTPCLQSFLSCFQGPLSAICFFFEVLVTGRIFPDFPLTTLTFLCDFFFHWLAWRWIDCSGGTCSHTFPAFEGDLFMFRSECGRMCVLCCSAVRNFCWNFLYMWHSHRTNAQTICPITLFGYCWEPESVPVVSSLSEGCFGKTLPWSLWCSSSPSAALLVACPVQNNVEISLNCCIFFFLEQYHCLVWKKPFFLDLDLTVWRLVAYASRQSTI